MLTEYQRYRIYEVLPGLSIWLTLILSFSLSFFRPLWMIYFIIVFDIYWMIKVLNFSFYLIVAWRRFSTAKKINWTEKMKNEAAGWKEKRHLVFLTLFNEDWTVVKTAIHSLQESVYDKSKFTLAIAGEERRSSHYESIYSNIKKEFAGCFQEIIGTMHPDLPDEVVGKGSNLNYSENILADYVSKKGWKQEDVIVTIFDIDTICHPAYFSYLTYLYCNNPKATRCAYQPVALYNNNIWESPSVLRIMAFGTTFWMMTSLARQDSLVTFSSHSMSYKALVDAGFHEKRIVSEDSRIFYQCLLAYNGDYEVVPMYIPISMDTVRDDSWWRSVENLYRQQRRWAWGVEHVPFLLSEFHKKGNLIPLWKKIKWIFVEWEGKWSWCLVAIIITVLGRLPMYVAPLSVQQSALYFNAPHILEYLMTISMLGLFLSAILSFPLLPKKPESHPQHIYLMLILQWLLLPISLIFVSSIPAIDAVTRLMFGKYLGFNISQKKRIAYNTVKN